MKFSLKSVIAAGLIALTCTCSAVAAPTEESLINEIGKGNGFYTLYTGMPKPDFFHNWKDIPGWEHTNNADVYSQNANYYYRRSYKINGSVINERVGVTPNDPEGTIYHISWYISSPDKRLIDEISNKIFEKLVKIYPEAKTLPRHYIGPREGLRFIRTGRGKEKLYFYNEIEHVGRGNARVTNYCLNVVYVQDPYER